jgi:hypothetical protein
MAATRNKLVPVAVRKRLAVGSIRPSAETLAVIAGLAVVAVVFLNVSPTNPPGFNRDEASNTYNAYTLESTGRDEYGARFPLMIRALNDWRSPLYMYVLAGVFRVTGPSTAVARTVSAVFGLAAIFVIFLLALQISGRRWVALSVALLAGLSPWLFELSRVAFEVSLLPLVLSLFFLVVYRAGTRVWRLRHSVTLGLLLAVITQTYTVGRAIAPLLALGLVLCWFRKWRQLIVVWAVFLAVAVVPIGLWSLHHPGDLESRYHATTWIVPGMSTWTVVHQYLWHYADNLNLWDWVTRGDPDGLDHVAGAGSLFFVEVALAIAGIVVVLLRRRADPWWRFMLYAVLVSPVAASATIETLGARPVILLALALPLLAIPALETIAALPAPKARVVFAALLVVFAVEAVHWQSVYWRNGPKRVAASVFDASSPAVINTALRENAKLYAFREDHVAYIQMLLDGAIAGKSPSSTVALDWGQRPPPGAHILLYGVGCPQCPRVLASSHDATAEYRYKPAPAGVMRTSFQMTSPLRAIGDPLDFTVWVENTGAAVTDHIILTVKLPPSMRITGAPYFEMGYGCTHVSPIVCNIGWFPGHKKTVIRYEVVVDRGGPQTMRASISTDELNVNTGPKSSSAFTVNLSPPGSARSSTPDR